MGWPNCPFTSFRGSSVNGKHPTFIDIKKQHLQNFKKTQYSSAMSNQRSNIPQCPVANNNLPRPTKILTSAVCHMSPLHITYYFMPFHIKINYWTRGSCYGLSVSHRSNGISMELYEVFAGLYMCTEAIWCDFHWPDFHTQRGQFQKADGR